MKSAQIIFSLLSAVFLMASCSSMGSADAVSPAVPSEPPFKNDEPDRYQVFIIQTTPVESVKFFAARDGDKWRIDSAYGTSQHTASIHNDKDYVLAFGHGVYSEYDSAHGYDERPDLIQEITHGMINKKDLAVYETIDSAGDLVRYKYIDPKGQESLVTFDAAKGIPVRKELFVAKDGLKTLDITISLEGFSTDVDPATFDLPKDLKRVTPQEMRSVLISALRPK